MTGKYMSCGSAIDHRSRCGVDGDQCSQCRASDAMAARISELEWAVDEAQNAATKLGEDCRQATHRADALQRVIDEARGQSFPRHPDPASGWVISTEFLSAVRATADDEFNELLTWEEIEAVLLSVEKINATLVQSQEKP